MRTIWAVKIVTKDSQSKNNDGGGLIDEYVRL
jgi:hypothetical protein